MSEQTAQTCPILTRSGDPCTNGIVWEVTPEGGTPYVCCGQHITAPLMREPDLVPFSARPI
ncbi:hypothetical protein [Streptomyces melanogenes]|uniref:hypothetical protein n=1 Tax=Streptomyces melanogenes TaxID=67326 RepID=UPI0037A0ED36